MLSLLSKKTLMSSKCNFVKSFTKFANVTNASSIQNVTRAAEAEAKLMNRLRSLNAFHEEHGCAPKQGSKQEASLASWINNIRQERRKGKLLQEYYDMIMSQCPWFDWHPNFAQFSEKLAELKTFHEIHGRAPKQAGKDREARLAGWIDNRRQERKQGRLSQEYYDMIVSECPWFDWDPWETAFREYVANLKAFHDKHGCAPKLGSKVTASLAGRMNKIRNDREDGKLSQDHYEMINSELPWFDWDPSLARFKEKLSYLKAFYDKYGRAPKQGGKEENEIRLAVWRNWILKEKKDGVLSEQYYDMINSKCPWFDWDPANTKFMKFIDEIKLYYIQHSSSPEYNHDRVSWKSLNSRARLSEWLKRKRRSRINGILRKEHYDVISEELPWFDWEPRVVSASANATPTRSTSLRVKDRSVNLGELMDKNYKILSDNMKAKNGKSVLDTTLADLNEFYYTAGRPPRVDTYADSNERKLAVWMISRRQDRKQGKLSSDDQGRITQICSWFEWHPYKTDFEEYVTDLGAFYEIFCRAPRRTSRNIVEKRLAGWMSLKRQEHMRGELSSAHRDEINERFPWFDWNFSASQAFQDNLANLKKFHEIYDRAPSRYDGREFVWSVITRYTRKKAIELGSEARIFSDEDSMLVMQECPWFDWNPSVTAFREWLANLKAFHDKHGCAPKGDSDDGEEVSLATWMDNRRRERKDGKLSQEYYNMIVSECPWFDWVPFATEFREGLRNLKAFYEKHGRAPKHRGSEEKEASLLDWIYNKRQRRRKGKLSQEYCDMINSECPWFDWNPRNKLSYLKASNEEQRVCYSER